MYTSTYFRMSVHMYLNMYMYTYIHVCMCVYMDTYTQVNTHTSIHPSIHHSLTVKQYHPSPHHHLSVAGITIAEVDSNHGSHCKLLKSSPEAAHQKLRLVRFEFLTIEPWRYYHSCRFMP